MCKTDATTNGKKPNQLTHRVMVGTVPLGGGAPVVVQSMLNAPANDVQIRELAAAGCEVVRMAIPRRDCLDAFQSVCDQSPLPVVADVHFDAQIAVEAARRGAAKLRINPGNIGGLAKTDAVLDAAGEAGIPINGLIWMGDYKYMLEQVEEKMKEGFRCVKLKIGAIDFDRELSLLKHIRAHFSAKEIELRVDANGAFPPSEAMDKLKRLAEMDLHSIEQPIRAGQWEEMARFAAESPLPIALDEELIGCNAPDEKRRLLETIHPQYIILKPSLHGGIAGCTEWVHLAETILGSTPERPKWWVTSALESQIGLNAIAQWCATLGNPLPQGLGTGEIFKDDKHRLIQRKGDTIWFTNDL